MWPWIDTHHLYQCLWDKLGVNNLTECNRAKISVFSDWKGRKIRYWWTLLIPTTSKLYLHSCLPEMNFQILWHKDTCIKNSMIRRESLLKLELGMVAKTKNATLLFLHWTYLSWRFLSTLYQTLNIFNNIDEHKNNLSI